MIEEEHYAIRGGNPISGSIHCYGAKNFATKAMIAASMADSHSELHNVPQIGDVRITQHMLESIGVKFSRLQTCVAINPTELHSDLRVVSPPGASNRMSILILSALLHKRCRVRVPHVGGCAIGDRSIDFHFNVLRAFGAQVSIDNNGYTAQAEQGLSGADFTLPYPSVGATESALFGAVCASGISHIHNIALEPEIQELVLMLRSMGALIYATSNERSIRVVGVPALHGTQMDILGDRIEAATWASLACATKGSITVHNIQAKHLDNFLPHFSELGGGFDLIDANTIRFYRAERNLKPVKLTTGVWPAFATDWQQPFAIVLALASGNSSIHETVYERRFEYLQILARLGMRMELSTECPSDAPCRFHGKGYLHRATIFGPATLSGNHTLAIPDLRAGLAFVIAAAVSRGKTILTRIDKIERGYGNIADRLRPLGLNIERVFPSVSNSSNSKITRLPNLS